MQQLTLLISKRNFYIIIEFENMSRKRINIIIMFYKKTKQKQPVRDI